MYALGHLGLGYLIGKGTAAFSHRDESIHVVLLLSLLPDVDLLIPFLPHRGPTHSIIVVLLMMLPFLLLYGRNAIPYALTLVTHGLIGDALTGGAQLLWPLSAQRYGFLEITLPSPTTIGLEIAIFAVALLVLLKTGEHRDLLAPLKMIGR